MTIGVAHRRHSAESGEMCRAGSHNGLPETLAPEIPARGR
jgi:hypothetical protein